MPLIWQVVSRSLKTTSTATNTVTLSQDCQGCGPGVNLKTNSMGSIDDNPDSAEESDAKMPTAEFDTLVSGSLAAVVKFRCQQLCVYALLLPYPIEAFEAALVLGTPDIMCTSSLECRTHGY